MTETSSVTWLTQEAYDRLKAELDHLSGEGRTEIARKIEEARQEGDLRENGGYHAAKEEQGKQEARIRQLRQLLENAKVGEAPASADGTIAPGMVVDRRPPRRRDDVPAGQPGGRRRHRRSTSTPRRARWARDHRPQGRGLSASYTAPNGKEITLKILSAEPFTH